MLPSDISEQQGVRLVSVSLCPSLRCPAYLATPWAAAAWPNMALLILKQRLDRWRGQDRFRRELLTMQDGGTVALDWDIEGDSLPPSAPLGGATEPNDELMFISSPETVRKHKIFCKKLYFPKNICCPI